MESKSNDNLYTTWHCPNCHGSLNSFFIYQGLHLALSCKAPPMLASCLGEYFQIFPLGHTQFALPNHCFQTFASMHCFLSSVPPWSWHFGPSLSTWAHPCLGLESGSSSSHTSQMPAILTHSLTGVDPGNPAGPELWAFSYFCWESQGIFSMNSMWWNEV